MRNRTSKYGTMEQAAANSSQYATCRFSPISINFSSVIPCQLTINPLSTMNVARPVSKQPMPPHAKLVFHGIVFDVYQWEQPAYDGTVKIFEKLKRPDTAIVIPVTGDGNILLSRQEQPGKAPFIGCLGGRVDQGEGVLEAAKRELLEESGYMADEWILFDAVQPTSKIDWAVFTFIAKDCKKVAGQNLDGAEKIELMPVDFDTFIKIVTAPDFGDQELKIRFLEAKNDPNMLEHLRKKFLE